MPGKIINIEEETKINWRDTGVSIFFTLLLAFYFKWDAGELMWGLWITNFLLYISVLIFSVFVVARKSVKPFLQKFLFIFLLLAAIAAFCFINLIPAALLYWLNPAPTGVEMDAMSLPAVLASLVKYYFFVIVLGFWNYKYLFFLKPPPAAERAAAQMPPRSETPDLEWKENPISREELQKEKIRLHLAKMTRLDWYEGEAFLRREVLYPVSINLLVISVFMFAMGFLKGTSLWPLGYLPAAVAFYVPWGKIKKLKSFIEKETDEAKCSPREQMSDKTGYAVIAMMCVVISILLAISK
ncbi:MAG: hypothetical protein LBR90_04435 [Elusimicrobiota bacterium]|jgi:hypothetical protein|nr:hypothetical protein [Elusimicrobiota bacterium]